MELDPDEVPSLYRTLAGAVVPRPIAWVSTTGPDGVDNLAPYSFFNVVAVDPPVVMFAPVNDDQSPEGLKDTPRNVAETGEFVVNVVTESLAEPMNETSATLPAGESEFDRADLERAESRTVAPPRVAGTPVAFECSLYEMLPVGGSTMVLGEVEWVHVDDAVTTAGKLDTRKLDAVGRLSGSSYATTAERFAMERPP
ncbi:flavin reductase family protein [Halorussus salilacus]|uniref:flavin reductase family protein n=1 Tax=Halorussus salilacus TaxID=2953750 RepID=UPI0020A032F8|nr:flavin reductase family protein [Halorussus salilacus]USZ69642.1 flavin reductase family protein [Halorussus salilacus]